MPGLRCRSRVQPGWPGACTRRRYRRGPRHAVPAVP